VQRPMACGPSEWPAGPTSQPPVSFLGSDALQEVIEQNPRSGVGGGRTPWPPSHMARLAGQHLASYRLNQVSNCSWDSYKYPLSDGIHTHHTLLVVLQL
jgi:hypothetical protein